MSLYAIFMPEPHKYSITAEMPEPHGSSRTDSEFI